jgi:hypothetical protein
MREQRHNTVPRSVNRVSATLGLISTFALSHSNKDNVVSVTERSVLKFKIRLRLGTHRVGRNESGLTYRAILSHGWR